MAATYKLISSNILSTTTSSITFSSIPSTYTDLVLRISGRTTLAAEASSGYIQMNSVTSTYSFTFIRGNGAAVASSNDSGGYAGFYLAGLTGNNATSSTFGSCEIYIPNYAGSTTKPVGQFSTQEQNSSSPVYTFAVAGLSSSTAAISSLTINLNGGASFLSDSSFYLYGIKNS